VTRPVMRTDLQPLCQRHYAPMFFGHVTLLSSPNDLKAMYLYSCRESRCTSCYNMECGYFTVILGEEIKRDATSAHRCSHDGFFMHISSFDAQTKVRVWKCSAENCSGSRMERYAAA